MKKILIPFDGKLFGLYIRVKFAIYIYTFGFYVELGPNRKAYSKASVGKQGKHSHN